MNLIKVLENHANTILNNCVFDNMLVDAIDRNTHKPAIFNGINIKTKQQTENSGIISNFANHQNFLRFLCQLSELTNNSYYKEKALEISRVTIKNIIDKNSHLFYWGGHSAYNLGKKAAFGTTHELKCCLAFYELLFEADYDSTKSFIEAFWDNHIRDTDKMTFNRHSLIDKRLQTNVFDKEMKTGELPFVDNFVFTFANASADLIYSACYLYKQTGDKKYLNSAKTLVSAYDNFRDKNTGLSGYLYNYRDEDRARASFTEPLCDDMSVNEAKTLANYHIEMRYGRFSLILFYLSELTGDSYFREVAQRDLTAAKDFLFEEKTGSFLPSFIDGRRFFENDIKENPRYLKKDTAEKLGPNGVMLMAYAKAYNETGDKSFLKVAKTILSAMTENGIIKSAPAPVNYFGYTDDFQCEIMTLQALIELDFMTESEQMLNTILSKCYTNFMVIEDTKITDNEQITGINSQLPSVLIKYLTKKTKNIDILPSFSYFQYK